MKPFYFSLISLIFISCSQNQKEKITPVKTTTKHVTIQEKALFTYLKPTETNIRFNNKLKENLTTKDNIYYFEYFYHGAGVSVGDINNDGLPDIFFTGNHADNKLYLNLGNMKFKDISKNSGINTGKSWATGTTMVDINNDGFLDIYVCQGGINKAKRENKLYINNKNETFTESAKTYGLNDGNLSTQAAFFDYDKDNDLDCIIINETEYYRFDDDYIQKNIVANKDKLRQNSTRFLENVDGKFVDKTEASGLLKFSYNLGVITGDFNGDLWPDIYITNDYQIPDYLYINQKDGTFKDEINTKTKQISWFSMGLDYNDINNDGYPDITVADMPSNDHVRSKLMMQSMNTDYFWYNIETMKRQYGYMFNTLQLNDGKGNFSNISHMAGNSKSEWSWANLLADFDNDTYKDQYLATGVRRDYSNNDVQIRLRKLKVKSPKDDPRIKYFHNTIPSNSIENAMFRNNGDLTFEKVNEKWGLNEKTFSNGAAYADLDLDGDLDLVVNNIDDFASIIKNNSNELTKNNYLQFTFPSNAQNYNSKIKVYLDNGEILFQEFIPSRGYCSSVEPMIHFGLGDFTTISKVEIIWPNGKLQTLTNVKSNQRIALNISNAQKTYNSPTIKTLITEINPEKIGLSFEHNSIEFNDFSKQVLLPYKHSTAGPCLTKGDFNMDGLEDLFIGNSKGFTSKLYFQTKHNTFTEVKNSGFNITKDIETVDAISFDFDEDGDLDILTINGSYEYEVNSPLLKDQLFINNGKGKFTLASDKLFNAPTSNSSTVCYSDIDLDGDLDLFIGGRVIPGQYPKPAESSIFINEKGKFIKKPILLSNLNLGIVKNAVFVDINQDKRPDLITVGDWENVNIYINNKTNFNLSTKSYFNSPKTGWWNTIFPTDIDGDGDVDLLVGNLGKNTKYENSKREKLGIKADDFDNNGTFDIVLHKQYHGKDVPVRGLQCSSEQMPFIKKQFASYEDFANADLNTIFGEKKVNSAISKSLEETRTGIYLNKKGKFKFIPLENIAQISPTLKFLMHDINKDGKEDVLLAGNLFDTEVETPRWDAGNGLILLNHSTKDHLNLKALPTLQSGLNIPNDFRDMTKIKRADGSEVLIVLNNNNKLQTFKL